MQTVSTPTSSGPFSTNETHSLIASDKVEGTAVYNRNGDHLGSIYNVMIDKVSGQVNYAVLSFGGFLGLGSSYHPLPWKALTYDTKLNGYVVDIDKNRLSNAPRYGVDETPDWNDRGFGRRIDEFYGY